VWAYKRKCCGGEGEPGSFETVGWDCSGSTTPPSNATKTTLEVNGLTQYVGVTVLTDVQVQRGDPTDYRTTRERTWFAGYYLVAKDDAGGGWLPTTADMETYLDTELGTADASAGGIDDLGLTYTDGGGVTWTYGFRYFEASTTETETRITGDAAGASGSVVFAPGGGGVLELEVEMRRFALPGSAWVAAGLPNVCGVTTTTGLFGTTTQTWSNEHTQRTHRYAYTIARPGVNAIDDFQKADTDVAVQNYPWIPTGAPFPADARPGIPSAAAVRGVL
jgi:hypothetical protein